MAVQAFDKLVLLKRGGVLIYSGGLGHQSGNLIAYFQSIPGVPTISEGFNPVHIQSHFGRELAMCTSVTLCKAEAVKYGMQATSFHCETTLQSFYAFSAVCIEAINAKSSALPL